MPARVTQSRRGRANYKLPGSNNVICDRTGFKIKVEDGQYEWNGLFVRSKSYERRQPQDLLRGFADHQAPEVSRPGGEDVFITPTSAQSVWDGGLSYWDDGNSVWDL